MKQGQTLPLIVLLLVPLVLTAMLPTRPAFAQESPPVAEPDPPLEPGGFIAVEGNQLTRLGQPVQIKGVNYYPQWRPWAEMWHAWDAHQIEHEWRQGRDVLGINAVRILVPYDLERDTTITRLRELVQIAGELDLRLIVTLFDFHNEFPLAGSAEEQRHFNYLEDLIGNFAGDDRIMAWDLHNEPDHYPAWQVEGKAQQVLSWLGRMADHVHRLAPNHLVTVGMGQYNNLWQPGPDGRRVIDYSDVVSVHIYNAADTERQLYELRTHTDKPILLQEFGWPSGPQCILREYNEETQAWVYRTMLEAAQGEVAGVVAWTLRDFHAGPTMRWDTREEHYGLFRPDDSLKPAAEAFGAYPSEPLPSLTESVWPLTVENADPPGGVRAPILIEGTAYYVKDWFRIAWEESGGQGMFGLPLGDAFVRPEDGIVVQYFEAAVLEYNPNHGSPLPEDWSRSARARRLIQPVDIGVRYIHSQGRAFPQAERVPEGGRRFSETGYSIQGEFRKFYEGSYGEWRLGAPLSEELVEEINGVPVMVQYFQRGRLEMNPDTGVIQYGQLGSWLHTQRCGL